MKAVLVSQWSPPKAKLTKVPKVGLLLILRALHAAPFPLSTWSAVSTWYEMSHVRYRILSCMWTNSKSKVRTPGACFLRHFTEKEYSLTTPSCWFFELWSLTDSYVALLNVDDDTLKGIRAYTGVRGMCNPASNSDHPIFQ